MNQRWLGFVSTLLFFVSPTGCASYAADGRDTYVTMVAGHEVTLVEPEAVKFAITARASEMLACPAPSIDVTSEGYGQIPYWTVEGCGGKNIVALAHRCPPSGERVCAATIVTLADGDPSGRLDPEMRGQSGDVIMMAYLVTRGAVDLVCPPTDVRLEWTQSPAPMTLVHGCGRKVAYVQQNGQFIKLGR